MITEEQIKETLFVLTEMISKRVDIQKRGYTDDSWREYEINEAQLRHLKRTKALILSEKLEQLKEKIKSPTK